MTIIQEAIFGQGRFMNQSITSDTWTRFSVFSTDSIVSETLLRNIVDWRQFEVIRIILWSEPTLLNSLETIPTRWRGTDIFLLNTSRVLSTFKDLSDVDMHRCLPKDAMMNFQRLVQLLDDDQTSPGSVLRVDHDVLK